MRRITPDPYLQFGIDNHGCSAILPTGIVKSKLYLLLKLFPTGGFPTAAFTVQKDNGMGVDQSSEDTSGKKDP